MSRRPQPAPPPSHWSEGLCCFIPTRHSMWMMPYLAVATQKKLFATPVSWSPSTPEPHEVHENICRLGHSKATRLYLLEVPGACQREPIFITWFLRVFKAWKITVNSHLQHVGLCSTILAHDRHISVCWLFGMVFQVILLKILGWKRKCLLSTGAMTQLVECLFCKLRFEPRTHVKQNLA